MSALGFSVLLSLYHKENPLALEQSFQSIWKDQTIQPDEIILVLDGPIGEELSQCVQKWQRIIGKSLRVIPLSQNVGLGKALNKGLEHCSNEWIFRMDTDDICKPDRFEKQIQFIQSNPNVVVVGGQILEFDHTPNDLAVIKTVPTTHEDIKKFAQKRCPFNHMTVAYKRDVILSLGGYQHHLFMEDYNLWLRLLGGGFRAGNLDESLVLVRVGADMLVRRRGLKYVSSEYKLARMKRMTGFQSILSSHYYFILRSIPRLLPLWALKRIYNITRK